MRKIYLLLLTGIFVFAISFQSCQEKTVPNQLTKEEASAGWKLLFDGTSSTGWRGYNKTSFPAGWQIADGAMHCVGSGTGEAGAENGGDIIFDKKFKNFDLKVEWKIAK